MKRCETPQMSLLPAKCSGGLTAPKTNTWTAQVTAERRLSTHTGPETGMEVRRCHSWAENEFRFKTDSLVSDKQRGRYCFLKPGTLTLKLKLCHLFCLPSDISTACLMLIYVVA